MNTAQLQQEIMRLKKEKDVCVLAHSYQAREICEIADYTGDSYKLSVDATKVPNRTILMCGVRFMAETCKLLSPEKTVLLAQPLAGCDMADQMDREMIEKVKADYPGYTVVAYVNTTAQLKTICDVCVTSSSAVQIVNRIDNKNILFIPDCNLGSYVAQQCPDKNIKLLNGGCPIHASVTRRRSGRQRRCIPTRSCLCIPSAFPPFANRRITSAPRRASFSTPRRRTGRNLSSALRSASPSICNMNAPTRPSASSP